MRRRMSFISRHVVRYLAIATIAVSGLGVARHAAAQATTGTIAGSVKDAQGGVIPGATITLVSEGRGTSIVAQTNATGDFVVPNIPGDIYTVRVAMDGFKTTERKGVRVSPGDRVAVGTVTIEQGALAETVVVSSEAPLIQAQTGERSFTVTTESVQALPVTGRNFASFATLTPGVIAQGTGAARADGARTNYLLDGVSSVDTGGNQQGLQINPDAIAEVKVIATAYQAEYGRTSGIQISGVTKSGTNTIHGSVFDLERRTAWNTNSWANQKNNQPKAVADQRDWGYTIGGPVGRPGGQNKIFFFYSEQLSPRKSGGVVNRFTVPTALERQGDFSKSVDNLGAPINLIRDFSTGLPCTAANTAGCFADGGVLGKIPAGRVYGLGLNVLNLYPSPTTSGLGYNLEVTTPVVTSNVYQHVARIDYQASAKLRVSAKYAGSNATVKPIINTLPGFNDQMVKYPANLIPSATVVYAINGSTVFEGTWGVTRGNQRGNVPISPNTNSTAVGLAAFPTLFANADGSKGIVVPTGTFQEKALRGTNVPFYSDGRIFMHPNFTFGNKVGNPPPNTPYPGFLCDQSTMDFAFSVTKLWHSHTFKVGYQSQDSRKRQNVGTQTAGVLPIEGSVDFGQDSNNPLDSGFGFSNAALGIFRQYQQQNTLIEGNYVYFNKDFYLQDNWKINGKLTLDYGVRFVHHGPQYDESQQASNFFSDKWSAAQAPRLYQPGCLTTAPCSGANLVAVNPLTGVSLGANSSAAIGTIVPNSGVVANGFVRQGQGIAKENYLEPGMVYGPRVGAAYDLMGNQRFVVRGSVGVFYDRAQGDSIFGQSGNPPTGQQSTLVNSTLQQVAAGATALQAPPASVVYYYDAKIGSSVNYNIGLQMALPWSSAVDVSFVGAHNSNSIAFGSISTPAGQLPIDRNAPDVGTAFLPQYQDSTKAASAVPGARAYVTDLLRPYRGLGAITTTWPRFHTQYDSIQTSYNRRFSKGWQAGLNWTLGLRFNGNTLSPQHFEHQADGSIALASYQGDLDKLLSNVGLRRHIVKANFVWSAPSLKGHDGIPRVVDFLLRDWQVSGILTAGSGAPYDATYSYTSGGANVNLTGSPSYAARIARVPGVDPGKGCSSDQYAQFNAAAFSGPTYTPGGSIGNESGVNLLTGCPDHTLDLALSRTIRLGGRRQVQFRLDAFNVLNTIVFNARATGIQYSNPTDPARILNNQFATDGSLNPARLTPNQAGAGAANGAQAMRTMQLQLRFMF
jgi:hypothetical protein